MKFEKTNIIPLQFRHQTCDANAKNGFILAKYTDAVIKTLSFVITV